MAARAGAGADRGASPTARRRWPGGSPSSMLDDDVRARDPPDPGVDLEGRGAARRVPARPPAAVAAGWRSSLVVYGRQLQGALSGWVSSTEHQPRPAHRRRCGPARPARWSPWPAAAPDASRAHAPGAALPDVPPVLRAERRAGGDRRATPTGAWSSWPRPTRSGRSSRASATTRQRHADAFRCSPAALTDDDQLADGRRVGRTLVAAAGRDQPVVPAPRRRCAPRWPTSTTGAGAVVRLAVRRSWCAAGAPTATSSRVLEECLDRAGLGELAAGARTAAIRVSFMLGYDRRRPLERQRSRARRRRWPRYLRRHGVAGRRRAGGTHGLRQPVRAPLGRGRGALLRLRLPRLPDRRHRRGPPACAVRPRASCRTRSAAPGWTPTCAS